jgi:hypothetical protein
MKLGKRIASVAAASLALAAADAARGEEVAICFDYGCSSRATVHYTPLELGQVQSELADADSPAAEREAVARAMGWLYFYAGLQSPIWRDRGGNLDDDGQPGQMDCIDHSTNTTAYLHLLERRGWLKFHRVGERVERGRLLTVHWGARLVERGTKDEWVVDTWFLDPGHPAAIFPLQDWLAGARPAGRQIFSLR